jgi:serine/threonine-protein kinase
LLGQRYRITAKLAETDLSQVFLAQDLRLGKRAVALKVIRRKSVEKSALSAFRRELEALSRLRHRGIVAILDVGVLPDGRAFLVMELVDGVSPRTILRQGAMERRRMARVLSQLGDTMAVTHRNGILHRDLKPENLMLEFPGTDRENLVILDFGTARIAVPDGSVDSYSGGTLDYMAPEQLFGFSSEKTDLYAVALLAFEMLTGKRLTELMCENPKEVDAALRRELASVLPAVPVAAIDLILHGANPDPALRPEDLEEWTGALTNILTQSGNI